MQPVNDEERRIQQLEGRLALAANHLHSEVMHATARAERAEHALKVPVAASLLDRALARARSFADRRGRSAIRFEPAREIGGSSPSPASLLAFPYYPANRWQDIMYSELAARGRSVVPLDRLDHEVLHSFGSGAVLHVNWTGAITQSTPDLVMSASSVRRAVGAIEEFQGRGGRVIWTVHNVLPHELHHLGPELVICGELAARADAITVMNPDTAEFVGDWYTLPDDRTVQIPHPSYVGYFDDHVSRSDARARFGLGDTDVALLFLGQLRPYKGLRELTDAFRSIKARNPRFRLLVAGEPGPGFTNDARRQLEADEPGRIVHIGRVPDNEMQWWCRAADLMVLPYRNALNVSLVTVASTFGLPVALKDHGTQRFLSRHDWVEILPPDEPRFSDALERAALRAASDPSLGRQANDFALEVAPDVVARQFTSLVDRLGGTRGE